MENNNFDIDAILDEIMPNRHLPIEELINNFFTNQNHNLPQKRIDEIFNDSIREIQNPNNSHDRKLNIMNNILTFTFFDSEGKNKTLYNALVDEFNNTQDNDYKFKIIKYVLNYDKLYTGHEEQLYNYSIDFINNQNYNNRINKAELLIYLLYKPILIQNHEDELYGLLQQFHDEIVNKDYLRNFIGHIYRENIDLFTNHRQYIEDLYNECQQIEEREREEEKNREIERRATFYDKNKPLTAFMQEIVCPIYISFDNFEALPLEQLVSNVDNAYAALRGDRDNIELQNNLATARNEFLNALRTLNNEDKECLLASIYQDLEKPVIFIMETNNKKHNINEELKEKTGISVDNLVEIFKQREQNNNLEENFIEIAHMPQPQVQELHDNNNFNIVQVEEENNIQEELEKVQENIQEVQPENRNFVQQLQDRRNNNREKELDEHGFPRRGGHIL